MTETLPQHDRRSSETDDARPAVGRRGRVRKRKAGSTRYPLRDVVEATDGAFDWLACGHLWRWPGGPLLPAVRYQPKRRRCTECKIERRRVLYRSRLVHWLPDR